MGDDDFGDLVMVGWVMAVAVVGGGWFGDGVSVIGGG